MKSTDKKRQVRRAIDRLAEEADALARQVWELAEPPFQEVQSARRIADFLTRHGFAVSFGFRSIPTAFRAERGRGRGARVGLLGEYDALPDCGARPGQWGHGCGHNLLGVGSAAAAVAAAAILEERRLPGRLVYYGCPAEENLAGKAYMARDGAFRDLDACLAWHPSATTMSSGLGGAALDSIVFEFFGRTAHAAYPAQGKSALDAAIIFDVAVNYLREELSENARIHAVIVDGGQAPNVVPAYARSWYYIRGRDRAQVDAIRARVLDCARGAAIATRTRWKATTIAAIYSRLANDALLGLVNDNLALFGSTPVTRADRSNVRRLGLKADFADAVAGGVKSEAGRASSDEDTVSWLAPLGRFNMACQARGTLGHHRQLAAQMTLPFALRGMRQASMVLAGAALDLLAAPDRLRQVRAEFKRRTRGFRFDPLLPRRGKVLADGRATLGAAAGPSVIG